MADGITLNAGSGGVTLKTDDDGTYHWQVVKLAFGADNTQTEVGSISSNPLPVALSSTDNAVLDNIQTAVELIDNAISGAGFNITQFAGAAVPIGAGVEATALRVTLATDSTGVLSVDDNGGSLTVDNAGITTIAGAVSGTEMQVDVLTSALPTGAATAANQSTANTALAAIQTAIEGTLTVGSHAVTNAGTFAVQVDGNALTALQLIDDSIFADDAAFTLASSKVTMSGAIRDDSLSALTAIEGDAVPLRVNSTGALHVTGGGGGTQYNVDDAAGGTDTGTLLLAVRDDSLTTLTPVDGDYVQLRVNSTGALHVTGGGGGTEYTEDVATANPIVGTATMMERDDALSTLTPIEGDWASMRCSAEGALWVQEFNSDAILALLTTIDSDTSNLAVVGGGTEAAAIRVTLASDSTGVLSVDDGGGALTVDNAGTFAVQVDGAALTALQLIDNSIVAHDAAASGSTGVSMAGGYATNSIEGITQVANADASHIVTDLNGVLVTRNGTTLEEVLSERISNTDGASTAFTTFAAGGAGVHNYVTSICVHNAHASTNGYVDIRDGTAGSVLWTMPAPATGGSIQYFDPPLKGSANTALAYDASAAITTIYVSVNGYQAQG